MTIHVHRSNAVPQFLRWTPQQCWTAIGLYFAWITQSSQTVPTRDSVCAFLKFSHYIHMLEYFNSSLMTKQELTNTVVSYVFLNTTNLPLKKLAHLSCHSQRTGRWWLTEAVQIKYSQEISKHGIKHLNLRNRATKNLGARNGNFAVHRTTGYFFGRRSRRKWARKLQESMRRNLTGEVSEVVANFSFPRRVKLSTNSLTGPRGSNPTPTIPMVRPQKMLSAAGIWRSVVVSIAATSFRTPKLHSLARLRLQLHSTWVPHPANASLSPSLSTARKAD